MKKVLVQSDDYGMSFGVVDGTIRAIKDGIVRNTGLFVNMDCAEYAAKQIKGLDVCLGIDINLVAGKPVTDPALLPHLLNEKKEFKSSRQVLNENKLLFTEKYIYHFEKDPFNFDEVLLETENQVKRFIELIGYKPEYLNAHSVITPNTERAAMIIADKYEIQGRSSDLYYNESYKDLVFDGDYQPRTIEEQLAIDYKGILLNKLLPSIEDNQISYLLCHCGYLDMDLFDRTSLTIQRIIDVAGSIDKDVIHYIKNNDIQLITYRDLYK